MAHNVISFCNRIFWMEVSPKFYIFLAICFINTSDLSAQTSSTISNFHRCGTSFLLESRTSKNIATQSQQAPYLTRPTLPGEAGRTGGFGHTYTAPTTFYDSPEGHFRIWYVTAGSDRPGAGRSDPSDADNNQIPDWVESCSEFFEQSWQTAVGNMGYRPPPEDFSFHAQYMSMGLDDGGDGRFDVYVQDIGVSIAGYTAPEQVVGGRQLPSYMVVDNDFSGVRGSLDDALDLLRATAAHEFFHAIQFGYDANEDIYWLEQTATWMEEQVFDDVNDYYIYLNIFNGFLTQPWKALDTRDGQHEFAGVLWPLFLSERFGQNIVRTIWELAETAQFQSLGAMDQALQDAGSNLEDAFEEFAIWNVFTDVRSDPTQYYEEGAFYPKAAPSDTSDTFPFSGPTVLTNQLPAHLGTNYNVFTPNALPGGLRFTFTGITGEWRVSIVGTSITGPDEVVEMGLSSNQQGVAEISGWDRFDEIVMVVSSTNRTGFNYQYQYSVAYDPDLEVATVPDEIALTTFPNPFVTSQHTVSSVRYDVPTAGRVILKIYNANGQEVRTLIDQTLSSGRFVTSWDGNNADGRRVSSGVYFCRLTIADNTGNEIEASGKMMMIK